MAFLVVAGFAAETERRARSREVEIGSASSRDGAGVSNHAIACRWAIRAAGKTGREPEPAVFASQKMPNNKQGVESRAGALLQKLWA
jgi:hypothetical protein